MTEHHDEYGQNNVGKEIDKAKKRRKNSKKKKGILEDCKIKLKEEK